MKRAVKLSTVILLVTIGVAFGIAGPVQAVPIPIGGLWQEFSFTGVGVLAAGCKPADPAGSPCVASVADNSEFVGAPAWTVTAPAQGAILTVTDAFFHGDSFDIFDSGVAIGATPFVAVGGTCASNPDICLADPLSSHAAFLLLPGAHAITVVPNASAFGGGSAYFRVDPVPEPSTMLLLTTGLAGLLAYGWHRRRRAA
jgi:hypothetical protein